MTRSQVSPAVRTSIALHWLTVLLFVAAYATMEFREVFPKGSAPSEAMKSWHYTAGLSIFVLAWLRLLLRAVAPSRAGEAVMGRWQAVAKTLTHLALYGLMIGLPLLGWLILSAEGETIRFFGFDLPALIGPNDGLAEPFEESHEVVAKVGYALIGIHALAALVHHYLLRDDTLAKMLPARS